MLSSLVKEHQLKQIKKKEEIEEKRNRALSSSTKFTTKLVNYMNDGVAQAYINQRRLDNEAKQLVVNIDQFSKSMNQWVGLMNNFNDALKQLGDVDNWAKVIENDMNEISSILEYVYKQQSNSQTSSTSNEQTATPPPPSSSS